MKKLIVFFLLALLLIGTNFSFIDKFNIFTIFDVAEIQVFTSRKNSCQDYESVDNGCGQIYFCQKTEISQLFNSIDYITGFTIIINDSNNLIDDIIDTFQIAISEKKNDNILGYSKLFPYRVMLNEKQISVQILQKDNKLYIGSPILLGSY